VSDRFPHLETLALRCGYDEVEAGQRYDHLIRNNRRVLAYVTGDVESLVHELCHWAASTPYEHTLPNLGMEGWGDLASVTEHCEDIVFFLEVTAYEEAGVPHVVPEENGLDVHLASKGYILLRDDPSAREKHPRWANIPEWFLPALTEALRVDMSSNF
jgi:hypothetical protein